MGGKTKISKQRNLKADFMKEKWEVSAAFCILLMIVTV